MASSISIPRRAESGSITSAPTPSCVRFADKIYPITAVLVGRLSELEGFDADRYIYRLDSRVD